MPDTRLQRTGRGRGRDDDTALSSADIAEEYGITTPELVVGNDKTAFAPTGRSAVQLNPGVLSTVKAAAPPGKGKQSPRQKSKKPTKPTKPIKQRRRRGSEGAGVAAWAALPVDVPPPPDATLPEVDSAYTALELSFNSGLQLMVFFDVVLGLKPFLPRFAAPCRPTRVTLACPSSCPRTLYRMLSGCNRCCTRFQ